MLSAADDQDKAENGIILQQKNSKLPFFIHELMCFYEQASSRTSWLKALSL